MPLYPPDSLPSRNICWLTQSALGRSHPTPVTHFSLSLQRALRFPDLFYFLRGNEWWGVTWRGFGGHGDFLPLTAGRTLGLSMAAPARAEGDIGGLPEHKGERHPVCSWWLSPHSGLWTILVFLLCFPASMVSYHEQTLLLHSQKRRKNQMFTDYFVEQWLWRRVWKDEYTRLRAGLAFSRRPFLVVSDLFWLIDPILNYKHKRVLRFSIYQAHLVQQLFSDIDVFHQYGTSH